MYIPPRFREDNTEALYELMNTSSFAILVTQQDGLPIASHLPLMIDPKRGPYGTIVGHMARANSQWQGFQEEREEQEALVIFQGPHAYITPSWYEVELSVPTWNYAAVHAYGVPRIVEDKAKMYDLLHALVQKHEAGFEQPWPFQLPDTYLQNMIRGTVGFEIEITRLEGKFKLSQNRNDNERSHVASMLEAQGDDLSVGVATLMHERNKRDKKTTQ